MTQVTLKLRPLPELTSLIWFEFTSFAEIERVLDRLMTSDTRPVAIEVLNASAAKLIGAAARATSTGNRHVLCVGLEGSQREVDWQTETLLQEISAVGGSASQTICGADADRVWNALTEFPTCADDPLTFQANLLPSGCMEFARCATELGVAVQVHAGNGIIIGQLPEEAATLGQTNSILEQLRRQLANSQGNLMVLHCDPEWSTQLAMCGSPEPGWGLMKRLKRQLDPLGLLNPGWFIDANR